MLGHVHWLHYDSTWLHSFRSSFECLVAVRYVAPHLQSLVHVMQLFLDIDPEAADMAESADQRGKNIIISRQHVARDEALRKAEKCIQDVEPIAAAVKRRLDDMQV